MFRKECNRCGLKWIKRIETEPKCCPKCKSPYWNKPRVRARRVNKLANKENK